MADDNPYGLSQQDISDLQDVRSHIPKGDPRGVKIDILLGGVTKPQPPSPVANQAFIQARNSMPSAPNPILANQPQTAGGQLGDEIGNFTTATNAKVAGMIGGIPDALKSVFAAPNVQEFVKQQAVNGIVNYIKDAAKAQKSGTPVTPAPLFVGASAMGLDPSAIREAALNKDLPSIAGEGAGTLATILGGKKLAEVAPGAAEGAIDSVPSSARAQANFQQVMAAAKNVPVDPNLPGSVALRIRTLAESGGSMPKVVRNFLDRVTNPDKGPLTYSEARDFYSNVSRLSVDEYNRLSPVMKREIGNFKGALGTSIQDATNQVGQGTAYSSAMTEYAKAARNKAIFDSVIKKGLPIAGKAAAGAIGATAGYEAYRKLTQ